MCKKNSVQLPKDDKATFRKHATFNRLISI